MLKRWIKWGRKHPHSSDVAMKAWLALPPVILTGNDFKPDDLGMPHAAKPRPWPKGE